MDGNRADLLARRDVHERRRRDVRRRERFQLRQRHRNKCLQQRRHLPQDCGERAATPPRHQHDRLVRTLQQHRSDRCPGGNTAAAGRRRGLGHRTIQRRAGTARSHRTGVRRRHLHVELGQCHLHGRRDGQDQRGNTPGRRRCERSPHGLGTDRRHPAGNGNVDDRERRHDDVAGRRHAGLRRDDRCCRRHARTAGGRYEDSERTNADQRRRCPVAGGEHLDQQWRPSEQQRDVPDGDRRRHRPLSWRRHGQQCGPLPENRCRRRKHGRRQCRLPHDRNRNGRHPVRQLDPVVDQQHNRRHAERGCERGHRAQEQPPSGRRRRVHGRGNGQSQRRHAHVRRHGHHGELGALRRRNVLRYRRRRTGEPVEDRRRRKQVLLRLGAGQRGSSHLDGCRRGRMDAFDPHERSRRGDHRRQRRELHPVARNQRHRQRRHLPQDDRRRAGHHDAREQRPAQQLRDGRGPRRDAVAAGGRGGLGRRHVLRGGGGRARVWRRNLHPQLGHGHLHRGGPR